MSIFCSDNHVGFPKKLITVLVFNSSKTGTWKIELYIFLVNYMDACCDDCRSHQPYVRFSVPVSVSVIKKLYDPTTLEEKSLTANVNRYPAGWRVIVSGKVKSCPGM